jgi:ABC-2 type transport system permease protein
MFLLPSILLSGFLFPFKGIPVWAQWIGQVFPATHALRIMRSVLLKGDAVADRGLYVGRRRDRNLVLSGNAD